MVGIRWRGIVASLAAVGVAACGGGGDVNSAGSNPPPAPPPVAQSPTAVEIFKSPASQEFAALGVGADLRLRYDATSGRYEVLSGGNWVQLVDNPATAPPAGSPNRDFVYAGFSGSGFNIRVHHAAVGVGDVYNYSNIANWTDPTTGLSGTTAIGAATPAGGVPVTGSATYNGIIQGFTQETFDSADGQGILPASLGGSIRLTFDFASAGLSGFISPIVYANGPQALPTLNFVDTIHAVGSGTFSGRFDTALAGTNGFNGVFTGPNGQEVIGKFAFPYLSPLNKSLQETAGVFIAKQ